MVKYVFMDGFHVLCVWKSYMCIDFLDCQQHKDNIIIILFPVSMNNSDVSQGFTNHEKYTSISTEYLPKSKKKRNNLPATLIYSFKTVIRY